MPNSYYTYSASLVDGSRARTGPLITEFQALEAAFDSLPADLDNIAAGSSTVGIESGSGNAYVVTMPTTRTSNEEGDEVVFKATHANTSAVTLSVDGLPAEAVKRQSGDALLGGDIVSGRYYVLRYNEASGHFVVMAPALGTEAGSVDFDTPSVSVGLAAVAGTGVTAMRSDAAPALSQSIVPTWTGIHTFNAVTKFASGTAAAPSITFSADTDSDLGLYRISEDLLGVAADGTLVFSVGLATTTFYNALTAGAGGSLVMSDLALSRALLQDYAEKVAAATISAGTLTLDYTAGPIFTVANNANITTFAVSNWPPTGTMGAIVLILTGNGTTYTQSWGSAVKWPGGSAPTITTTNGKRDYIVLNSSDAGTTIDASRVRTSVG
jgi:hypothetical protein